MQAVHDFFEQSTVSGITTAPSTYLTIAEEACLQLFYYLDSLQTFIMAKCTTKESCSPPADAVDSPSSGQDQPPHLPSTAVVAACHTWAGSRQGVGFKEVHQAGMPTASAHAATAAPPHTHHRKPHRKAACTSHCRRPEYEDGSI
jgi:hypothetical protein